MEPVQHLYEEELKTQLLEGSKEAFEELYNLFSPGLFLQAYAIIKDRELAKDLVQDLFAHLWILRMSFYCLKMFGHRVTKGC